MDEETMGLDDQKTEQIEPANGVEPVPGIPYCRVHHCRMTATSSRERVAYYQCPVPDCKVSGKRIRADERCVPRQPQECPRCGQFCERSDKRSDASSVVLVCPGCGWSVGPLPVPQIGAIHSLMRRQRDREQSEFGSR